MLTQERVVDVEGPSVPRIAWWPLGAVAAATGVVHLVLASFDGRWIDEALMLAIGRHHLDLGSADQPPVAPLLAWLTDTLAPGSQLAMRLPAVLATALAVLLAGLVARELGGDRRAQTLTALAQATTVWGAVFGHWLTPYSLEPVTWLAIVWLLVRRLRVRDDRLLLVLGVVVGIAAETKFQVLLLCAVLLVCVAVLGPRELLRRPRLWVGALVAAALAAPTLVWQALHGWPQLAMGPVVASEADALYGGRAGITVQLVVGAGLLGVVLGVYGLGRLLRSAPYRFLGVTVVVLFVFFVVTQGRPYYLAGLYGLLAAAGALGLQRRREAGHRRWRWVAWPAGVLGVALAAATLPISTALSAPAVPDRIVATTASAYGALPPAQRARTAVVGESYVYAAYVDTSPAGTGLPQAHSLNRSYGYFDPPSPDQDAALWIGQDPTVLRPYFADARQVAVVPSEGRTGLGGEDTSTTVWLLTGRHAPWGEVYDTERGLSVS